MPLVVGIAEIPANKVNQPGSKTPGSPGSFNTTFMRAKPDTPDAPTAAINRYPGDGKANVSAAHFHQVDQFQVIMDGSGDFGRHPVKPYYVHFSRAYTPYGPLQADKKTGWAFMVLRSRFDPGAQRFPQSMEKLKQVPNRQPWQVTTDVSFPERKAAVNVQDISEIKDDQGLFTKTVAMAANARTMAPDPSIGDGQYVVVVKGSLVHEGKERVAPAVVFTRRDEPAFEIVAGAQGLEAIILNFPKVRERVAEGKPQAPAVTGPYKTLQCTLCAFVYDEEAGWPDEGIAPGTRWADVPDTWTCPDCSAKKADFNMIEI
jgi:rubredoxin